MSAKNSVPVKILDQTLNITTDASPERLEKIVDFVSRTMDEIQSKSKKSTPYTASLLTALIVAEKYFDALDRQSQLKKQVSEKSQKILGLLDSVRSN